MIKKKQGATWHKAFVWKFNDKKDAELFDLFRLIILSRSSPVELVLLNLIRMFVDNNSLEFTPMLEPEALYQLSKDGLRTTRMTVKKYRDLGVLVDDDGKPFWFTDGHNIGYNYEKLKKFVANRKKVGVEPLIK